MITDAAAAPTKILVAGWFSFEEGHATAGDLLARDIVCEWLAGAGYRYDVAVARPFRGGVDFREARPESYSHAVFVCGPFERKRLEAEFLGRFARCFTIGVNLTMITPVAAWNPFDALFERDSSAETRPDLIFLSRARKVPVIGRCLVEPYDGALDARANDAIARLLGSREAAVVEIDTRLDRNSTGLRTPGEIESLVARMDVVVTTRLHGMVLALKNGVPVIAIDPETGGGKVKRQAATVAWPVVFTADMLSDDALQTALEYCLTDEARQKARECGADAAERVAGVRTQFLAAIRAGERERTPLRQREREEFAAEFTASAPFASMRGDDGAPRRGWRPVGSLMAVARGLVVDPRRRRLISVGVRAIPRPVRAALRSRLHGRDDPPPVGEVRFGDLRRVEPLSRKFGYDRGHPVDRYYIEQFLARHADDVRGRVLEIGDDSYTRRFGGARVRQRDVLHINHDHPGATIIADLSQGDSIPSGIFDCFILTQTLHLIYDVPAALKTIVRILKPGGVVLATVPGISQIDHGEWHTSWYWAFTTLSVRRRFEEVFPAGNVTVHTYGNVLAAVAFLYGIAQQELRAEELDHRDRDYEVIIAVRAVKPGPSA